MNQETQALASETFDGTFSAAHYVKIGMVVLCSEDFTDEIEMLAVKIAAMNTYPDQPHFSVQGEELEP